jgi:integrase/recombinase XerC
MWRDAIGEYFTMLRAAGRSPQTIRLHRHYLNQLAVRHEDPRDIEAIDLHRVIAQPSWGAETRKSARTVYRGFFRWLKAARHRRQNPAEDLPSVRVNEGTPRPTPESVALAVMNHPDQRIRFMALLAGLCGLRVGEIARVHSDDYDVTARRLLVHGKGDKERSVPVVHEPLHRLLAHVDGWAFPGRTDGHLSPGHVTRILSDAMPEHWTAHTLRHLAGTRAYRGTRDVLAVSKMLGHARTETTQRYVQMDDEGLLAAMNAAAQYPPAS